MIEAMGSEVVRAHLALRRYELGRWEAAGETWDPESIAAWELDAYLPVLLTSPASPPAPVLGGVPSRYAGPCHREPAYSGVWQTASTLLPSGSRTNAP